MTKKILSGILFLTCFVSVTCSKKDEPPADNGLSNTPMAKAAYDNNNFGIYKGVFVGSSGTVLINVNNDNTVTAILKVDGSTYNFTSSQTIQPSQATIINFVNGTNSFTYSSGANGSNPTVTNVVLSGHPYSGISVLKETSTSQVKVYEGTYKESAAGGETGVWNMQISTTTVGGEAKVNGGQFLPYPIIGTISNNQINGTSPAPTIVPPGGTPGTVIQATISGDNFSGTFSNVYGGGTLTGKRTL